MPKGCAATDFVFCVALMDGVTGERISAMPMGPIVKGYGTVTAKALVSPTTDGTWIDAATGNRPCALALEAATAGEAGLWALYDQIQAQTLLIRGGQSDLLTAETAWAMTQRGPRAQLEVWPDCGHAPTLTAEHQMAVVSQFVRGA
jgi:pimeloyl-ACP methyl ester carboxylesterase